MAANGRVSARIADYSDRELLGIVARLLDSEGQATTGSIAWQLFPSARVNGDVTADARRCIGQRLSWLTRRRARLLRKTTVEQDGQKLTAWELTEKGEAVRRARITKALEGRLSNLTEEEWLPLLTQATQAYGRASSEDAWLLRREWTHGTAPR